MQQPERLCREACVQALRPESRSMRRCRKQGPLTEADRQRQCYPLRMLPWTHWPLLTLHFH